MEAYVHKVQYYETDQMGVVHHSNYIRWFEEACAIALLDLLIYERAE
jgi:acyl-CoA thioester hydrolase